MARGTRVLSGKHYILFNAMDDFSGVEGVEPPESLASEIEAAKTRWEYVRVIRNRRRFRTFIYVFGAR